MTTRELTADQKRAMETARKAALVPSDAVHRRVAAALLRERAAGMDEARISMNSEQFQRTGLTISRLRSEAEAMENPT